MYSSPRPTLLRGPRTTKASGDALQPFPEEGRGAVPSASRITLLRDPDGDGVAETRSVFLSGLNAPFGMALVGKDLYVANADAIVRFPYAEGETRIAAPGSKVVDLPAGRLNHHWTKNVIAAVDGSKLRYQAQLAIDFGSHALGVRRAVQQGMQACQHAGKSLLVRSSRHDRLVQDFVVGAKPPYLRHQQLGDLSEVDIDQDLVREKRFASGLQEEARGHLVELGKISLDEWFHAQGLQVEFSLPA